MIHTCDMTARDMAHVCDVTMYDTTHVCDIALVDFQRIHITPRHLLACV